jgi:hypothetical protein
MAWNRHYRVVPSSSQTDSKISYSPLNLLFLSLPAAYLPNERHADFINHISTDERALASSVNVLIAPL